MKHKRNSLLNNLGKADITAHVNFTLLREFLKKWFKSEKRNYTKRIFRKKWVLFKELK